jgi:hypothetical protein
MTEQNSIETYKGIPLYQSEKNGLFYFWLDLGSNNERVFRITLSDLEDTIDQIYKACFPDN